MCIERSARPETQCIIEVEIPKPWRHPVVLAQCKTWLCSASHIYSSELLPAGPEDRKHRLMPGGTSIGFN